MRTKTRKKEEETHNSQKKKKCTTWHLARYHYPLQIICRADLCTFRFRLQCTWQCMTNLITLYQSVDILLVVYYTRKKIKIHSSCEIEDSVQTHP